MCMFSSIPSSFWNSLGFHLVAENDKALPSVWVFGTLAISNFQDSLSSLHVTSPWLVLGDINSVMGAHETTGIIKRRSCEDFRAGITLCNMIDLGSSFT
ncbi:hypothetical protein PanWU01x14_349870 [Parasponia andersonii]|uniref:Endonuclease/exonuclease/phosphatase n=1 Tax=Parasponia andersonii TaxID=3476 RepID=A0A2P5AB60_PARAD|nr:hypothetical protein PanWU01x14_349870 [Parasponia andersonii]